ncbi:MAG: hypothetical protein M9927_03715 [Anaerolineae bacterium]|nr:hypothetical protein [Anaerolineae bacterium]
MSSARLPALVTSVVRSCPVQVHALDGRRRAAAQVELAGQRINHDVARVNQTAEDGDRAGAVQEGAPQQAGRLLVPSPTQ